MLAGLVELRKIIFRVFYQRDEYIVIQYELSQQSVQLDSNSDLDIRQVTESKELASLRQMADENDMVRFQNLFNRGSIAFIAFRDDQPAGYCWVSEKLDKAVHRVQAPLQAGDAYVHDLFVSPAYRRHGIGKALISYRLHFLKANEYKRAVAIVLKNNAPALSVDKKVGYIHAGELVHTRVLFSDRFAYRAYGENQF